MKIGFLTSIREDHTLPEESFYKRMMVNLAPLYLAAYLEKKGQRVDIFIKNNLQELLEVQPEVLGVTAVTENFEWAKILAKRAKEAWNPITVLGGAHITALPQTLPASFDIGVIGEGEETLSELLEAIRHRKGLPPESELKNIPGIVFHSGKALQRTAVRKGLKPLDSIPPPQRAKYVHQLGLPYMMTSRGCPYTCEFCVIPGISDGYRTHSPQYVLEEIKTLKKEFPHIQHVRIFDDLFIVDRKRVAKIADLIEAEGLNQELSFACWGRGNLLDEEMVRTLKKMNMYYVAFGAESGSSRILSKIKPGSSLETNQEAIDRLHDHGISSSCSIIMGHPAETEEDLLATYEFLEKNMAKILEIEFNVAIPWPGTQLWNEARQRGLVNEDMDFSILKEAGCFHNYSTKKNPYINRMIKPERFEELLDQFRKLYWIMAKRMLKLNTNEHVNPRGETALFR